MPLISVNLKPTENQLHSFGWITLVMLAVIALLLHRLKGLAWQPVGWISAAGLVVFILSLISTKLVKPVYIGLQLVTFPIGLAVSLIIMAVFYYLVLTPVGLVSRLLGRDSLNRKFDKQAKTYWVRYKPPDSVGRYFKQF